MNHLFDQPQAQQLIAFLVQQVSRADLRTLFTQAPHINQEAVSDTLESLERTPPRLPECADPEFISDWVESLRAFVLASRTGRCTERHSALYCLAALLLLGHASAPHGDSDFISTAAATFVTTICDFGAIPLAPAVACLQAVVERLSSEDEDVLLCRIAMVVLHVRVLLYASQDAVRMCEVLKKESRDSCGRPLSFSELASDPQHGVRWLEAWKCAQIDEMVGLLQRLGSEVRRVS